MQEKPEKYRNYLNKTILIPDYERSLKGRGNPPSSKRDNRSAYLEIGCTFRTHNCLVRNFLFKTASYKVRHL